MDVGVDEPRKERDIAELDRLRSGRRVHAVSHCDDAIALHVHDRRIDRVPVAVQCARGTENDAVRRGLRRRAGRDEYREPQSQ